MLLYFLLVTCYALIIMICPVHSNTSLCKESDTQKETKAPRVQIISLANSGELVFSEHSPDMSKNAKGSPVSVKEKIEVLKKEYPKGTNFFNLVQQFAGQKDLEKIVPDLLSPFMLQSGQRLIFLGLQNVEGIALEKLASFPLKDNPGFGMAFDAAYSLDANVWDTKWVLFNQSYNTACENCMKSTSCCRIINQVLNPSIFVAEIKDPKALDHFQQQFLEKANNLSAIMEVALSDGFDKKKLGLLHRVLRQGLWTQVVQAVEEGQMTDRFAFYPLD